MPLCGTIKHDKEHSRPDECPAPVLPFADEHPVLPKAEEVGFFPDEEHGGVLPNAPIGVHALPTTAPCKEIKGGCPEEKKKTGDEKGPVDQRTTTEKALEQFALVAGAFNLQLDEDLKRPDGKTYGVVGGRNPDGFDNPVAQAVAAILQLSPLAHRQIEAFFVKHNKALAKKVVAVYTTKELSKEAAEHLAKMDGALYALHEARSIGPYKWWAKFTEGFEGRYQAHHIVEKKWFGQGGVLKGDPDLVPSVILSDAEHKVWNKKLPVATEGVETAEDLWAAYKKAYAKNPEWLAAIKSYFPNAK